MRTTIAIDEDLMAELMRSEPGASRSEAVRRAVKDYLARKRVDEFMKLAGSGLVDRGWREMERLEMEHAAGRRPRRHGRKR
jgi:metal-responsive CopG/Arc/MetJ family transcriptional regulator